MSRYGAIVYKGTLGEDEGGCTEEALEHFVDAVKFHHNRVPMPFPPYTHPSPHMARP